MPVAYRFFPVLFLITAVAPAAADPVTLVTASRVVTATVSSACCGRTSDQKEDLDNMAATAVAPQPDPSAVASGFLLSSIQGTDRFFYGQGSVSSQVTGPGGVASGDNFYSLTLDLSQPQNFTFIGVFDTARANEGDTTTWSAMIANQNDLDAPAFDLRGSDSIDRYEPGMLPPGRYDFQVIVGALSTLPGGLATGHEDFRLEFSDVPPSPTPEPASLLLLGSGAALLITRRRTAVRPPATS